MGCALAHLGRSGLHPIVEETEIVSLSFAADLRIPVRPTGFVMRDMDFSPYDGLTSWPLSWLAWIFFVGFFRGRW
jgi:hypothetical protein